MHTVLELFAKFLLALVGFVMPMLALIITFFGQGFSKLATQYEAENSQVKKKLSDQLKEIGETTSIDEKKKEKQILSTIKELKHIRRNAEAKLRLLSPKKAILNLFIPLAIAFCTALPILFKFNYLTYSLFVLSVMATVYAIIHFWWIFDIIVEIKKTIDADSKDEQKRIPELLAQIANELKEGGRYFLEKVYASFLGVELKKEITEVSLSVNVKTQAPVSFHNNESRMAKDVEVGFRFPLEYLVEKGKTYTIYSTNDEQIVRYSADKVQGNTELILSPLIITPLKVGQYDIKSFIKGENIETKNRTLKINVQ